MTLCLGVFVIPKKTLPLVYINPYLKNTIIILTVALIACIGACKKENNHSTSQNQNTQPSGPDFRDSLVGNYNCIEHYYHWILPPSPFGTTTDTIVGQVILNISKSASNDSSLVINGALYTCYFYSSTTQAIQYNAINANNGLPGNLSLTLSNDSIWVQQYDQYVSQTDQQYNYWIGHKQ